MNAYFEMSTAECNRRNTVQGYILVPGDKRVPPVGANTYMGPWPWQWSRLRNLVLSPPPRSIPITIKALMDDIEKVGTLGGTCVSLIADKEYLGRAWDVQNYHRREIFQVT